MYGSLLAADAGITFPSQADYIDVNGRCMFVNRCILFEAKHCQSQMVQAEQSP
jgi:hypothetical protein